jgi:hypothetical protein
VLTVESGVVINQGLAWSGVRGLARRMYQANTRE